jgi:hypothetical protein
MPADDQRSPQRRAQDERPAAEPERGPLDIPAGAQPAPVEAHLGRRARRPLAVTGIVENGLVRPLDGDIKLPEHSPVIIVTSEGK